MSAKKIVISFILLVLWILAIALMVLTENAEAKTESPHGQWAQYIVMPQGAEHLRSIHRQGVNKHGNRPAFFSKVGESTVGAFENLYYVGSDQLILGDYAYLQPTVDYYKQTLVNGTVRGWNNSFQRGSLAATGGLIAANFIDGNMALRPRNAQHFCINTPLLQCELNEAMPGIALIQIGTNDLARLTSPDVYRSQMETIIDYTIERGTVPVLYTIQRRCPNFQPTNCYNSEAYNEIIRDIAAERRLPLIELAKAIDPLPAWGLSPDYIHLNATYPNKESTAQFIEPYMQNGYNVRNLLTIMLLHDLRAALGD